MRQRTAVLHVGTHKTGTTSLQSMFGQASAPFPQIYYPRTGRPAWETARHGHHNLAWELNADPRHDPGYGTIADLRTELAHQQADRVLLSSEDFELMYREPTRLNPLLEMLSGLGYQVHVVMVFREPVSYVESLFHQLHLEGYAGSLTTFLAEVLDGRAFVTFDRVTLREAFGSVLCDGAVHTVDYNPSDSIGPVLDVLGRSFGLALPLPMQAPRLNVRSKEQLKLRGGRLSPYQRRIVSETFADERTP